MVDNPPGEEVIVVDVELEETHHLTFFTAALFFVKFPHILNLSAAGIRGLMESLGRLWTDYYPRLLFSDEAEMMPRSTLTFIVTALLSFAEIKSQGNPHFPFQTHPHAVMVSITSLLLYGFASAAENVISAAGLDPTSTYAIIARLGRIGTLSILVASLASFFYS